METLNLKRQSKISKLKKPTKTYEELTFSERERVAFFLVNKHFEIHNSVTKTSLLWKKIFDILKKEIFHFKNNLWMPENLKQILNF